ncbi:hypothetical protein FQA39_LY17786 [Lamprigera yunnana]|nr:hypothetical protein FQA39_LY17786 [Lamprigera yunnana]
MDIHKQVGELRLMSEFDLQWLPLSYLKRNTKSTEITEACEKLPLDIRNNEEMKTYLLCTKHWNLLSWGCHLDGPPPQKRNHPVLYKKDLDASYKIKLDSQDATGYAVNDDDEMRRSNEISKAIAEPEIGIKGRCTDDVAMKTGD